MVLDKVNNMSNNKQRPIGVFDSGVGGLTNVRALMERLPMENIVYFGDTARAAGMTGCIGESGSFCGIENQQ